MQIKYLVVSYFYQLWELSDPPLPEEFCILHDCIHSDGQGIGSTSGELARQAECLKVEVERFLVGIRVA